MADFALTMGVACGGAGPGSVSHGALAVGVELLERDETFAVLDGLVAEVRGDGICEAVARLRQGSASGTKGARAPLQCDRAFDSPRLIGTVVAFAIAAPAVIAPSLARRDDRQFSASENTNAIVRAVVRSSRPVCGGCRWRWISGSLALAFDNRG